MKRLIWILVFTLSIGQLMAQSNKNTFNTEVGSFFSESNNFQGFCFSNEFSRTIVKNLNLGLRIEYQDFMNNDFSNLSLNKTNISLNLYYNFEILKFAKIQTGIGSYLSNSKEKYFSESTHIIKSFNNNFPVYNTNSLQYSNIGYTASLGLIIPLNNLISFSFRAVFQSDTNKNIIKSLRPGLNFKF